MNSIELLRQSRIIVHRLTNRNDLFGIEIEGPDGETVSLSVSPRFKTIDFLTLVYETVHIPNMHPDDRTKLTVTLTESLDAMLDPEYNMRSVIFEPPEWSSDPC